MGGRRRRLGDAPSDGRAVHPGVRHLVVFRRRDGRRAAVAGRAGGADLREGRRPQYRHRGHDADGRLWRLLHRLRDGVLLAWLPRRRRLRPGRRVYHGGLLRPPGDEPDRHRHRPDAGCRGADGVAPSLSVLPHLSAAAGDRDAGTAVVARRPGPRPGAVRPPSARLPGRRGGVRPGLAVPALPYRPQSAGRRRQPGGARRRRRQRDDDPFLRRPVDRLPGRPRPGRSWPTSAPACSCRS